MWAKEALIVATVRAVVAVGETVVEEEVVVVVVEEVAGDQVVVEEGEGEEDGDQVEEGGQVVAGVARKIIRLIFNANYSTAGE